MPILVGAILALATGLFATTAGLDRDRAFYPTVSIVVASYYVLFAVLGGSPRALVLESLVAACFLVVAVFGFKSSLWLVVIALAAHGALDVPHDSIITNPGVPSWWWGFCGTFDVVAAGYLAWTLMSKHPLFGRRHRAQA